MDSHDDDKPGNIELIQAVEQGNGKTFDVWIERYYKMVYVIAFSRLKQEASAEDLTQEVFLRAYLNLDKLTNPELIAGWLVRVTNNLATDWIRKGIHSSELVHQVPLMQGTNKTLGLD